MAVFCRPPPRRASSAVGSINRDFRRSCFSNYGVSERNGPGGVDIVAPGGEAASGSCAQGSYGLLSTAPGNRYKTAIGTSFATPMVAGAAALIMSQEPNLSVSQVEAAAPFGAYFERTMNRDEYGRGALRVERSLGLAGPGDRVSVSAVGENVSDSSLATVTLDLYGGSSPYSLEDLAAGRYRVEAAADGLKGEKRSPCETVSAAKTSRWICAKCPYPGICCRTVIDKWGLIDPEREQAEFYLLDERGIYQVVP